MSSGFVSSDSQDSAPAGRLNKRDTADATAPPYFILFFFLHIIQLYNLIRLCVPQHPRMPKRKKSQAAQSQNDLPAAVRTSASTAQHVSDFETY